jgi:hypothetical protein
MRDDEEIRGPLARLAKDQKTEEMSEVDIRQAILGVTGESASNILEMVGLEGSSADDLRRCLHHAIVLANECGQPIVEEGATAQEEAEPPAPGSSAGRHIPEEVREEIQQIKANQVASARAHLISLSSSGSSEDLVLASLDALVDLAQKVGHKDVSLLQSLRAQALRLRGQLSIQSLILDVLSEKQDDKISAAIARGLKEGKQKMVKEKKDDMKEAKGGPSLNATGQAAAGAMAGSQQWQPWGSQYPGYSWQGPPGMFSMPNPSFPPTGGPRFQSGFQPKKRKIQCFACGEDHLLKDCAVMNKLKKDK